MVIMLEMSIAFEIYKKNGENEMISSPYYQKKAQNSDSLVSPIIVLQNYNSVI